MKFKIYTAGDIFKRKKPCAKAILEGNIWVIEINTLEDVLNLMKDYGDLIFYEKTGNMEYPEICIYDDYVE